MSPRNNFREMPLGRLLASLFLMVLVAPLLGLGLMSWTIEFTNQARVETIQGMIQETDNLINTGIATQVMNDISPYLERGFYKDGNPIARDTLIAMEENDQFQLIEREYYRDNIVVARDVYGPLDGIAGIVKRREYYNRAGILFIQEWFNEAGIGLPKECLTTKNDYQIRRNPTRSPFPPPTMFYVTFYR